VGRDEFFFSCFLGLYFGVRFVVASFFLFNMRDSDGTFAEGFGDLDAGVAVVIDGGESAEEKIADVGEDGSAAGRDVAGGEELVEIAEGVVDTLSGLKALPLEEQRFGEIGELILPMQVLRAERGARVLGERTALAAGGGAIGTASGEGWRLGFHGVAVPVGPGVLSELRDWGTHPGCFGARVWKVKKRRGIRF